MKTIIHVNQQTIVRNRKTGSNDPPLIVRTYKGSQPAHTVEILGPSRVVNRPHDPLPCGARVWIETEARVVPSLYQGDSNAVTVANPRFLAAMERGFNNRHED